MQFKHDARVVAFDGKDVGRVDRVVIEPRTKEVTHIVVQRGFLFTEDKVVPISLIASADEDEVTLRGDAGDLNRLLPFEEVNYIPLNNAEANAAAYPADYAPPLYAYPSAMGWVGYSMNYPSYYPPRIVDTEQNIPDDTVALAEGARVISADGEHVGNVERVLTEPEADRATSFIISQGLFFTERKRIPISWVSNLEDDAVYLSVRAELLKDLRAYQED